MNFTDTDLEAIQTIRGLSIDAIEKAKSGTQVCPAPLTYVLWKHFLKFSPQNPDWLRDRFILSAGHGSMAPLWI